MPYRKSLVLLEYNASAIHEF